MIYRKILSKIQKALKDTPVIFISGPRQAGKTTLVKYISENIHPAKYLNFDDATILAAAKTNPEGFLEVYKDNLILDEVQRVPEIFLVIKKIVDNNRKPGKFILTGSANIFLLPKISESLVGRMEIIKLFPISLSEISESKDNFIEKVISDNFSIKSSGGPKNDLIEKILSGGFPEVISRKDKDRQNAWFNSYITTLIERDVRDITNIERLTDLPRLLKILASRVGTLLNFAEISRSASIPQTTLKRYITLFEALFLIYFVPTWSGNISKRAIKTPKLYFLDTGIAAYLIGFKRDKVLVDAPLWGKLLENFILTELLKQLSWSKIEGNIFYYRTASAQEIDFIIERRDGKLIAIEVKSNNKVDKEDFKHIVSFSEDVKKKFLRGIVFYTGEEFVSFGNGLYAVPISYLW